MSLRLRKTLKRSSRSRSRSRSRNYRHKRAGRRNSRKYSRKHSRKHSRRVNRYRGGNSNAQVQDASKLLHKGDMPYMPYTRDGKTYSGFQFE